jgi:hypothetical protein
MSATIAIPSVADVAALRRRLWAAGFRPVPVVTGAKRTIDSEWPVAARQDPPAAAVLPPARGLLNTGILCDGLRVVDIDVDDPQNAACVHELAVGMLGQAPTRSRTNSPRVALLYRAAEGEPRKRWVGSPPAKVEVLGKRSPEALLLLTG